MVLAALLFGFTAMAAPPADWSCPDGSLTGGAREPSSVPWVTFPCADCKVGALAQVSLEGDALAHYWCETEDGVVADGPYAQVTATGHTIRGQLRNGKPHGAFRGAVGTDPGGETFLEVEFDDGTAIGNARYTCKEQDMAWPCVCSASGSLDAGRPHGDWAETGQAARTCGFAQGVLHGQWSNRVLGVVESGTYDHGTRAGVWATVSLSSPARVTAATLYRDGEAQRCEGAQDLVDHWRGAWQSACTDMDAYMAYYDEAIRAGYLNEASPKRDADRPGWQAYKSGICDAFPDQAINISVSVALQDPGSNGGCTVTMCQYYTDTRNGELTSTASQKVLALVTNADGWRIVSEDEVALEAGPLPCPTR